ncbi:MAG: CDP-glycerol glycerophosphotransferase family protein [Eubacterium sp.]
MWLDKSNIETLYAPKKRNIKKSVAESIKKFAVNIAKRQDYFRKESRKILLDSRKKNYNKIRDSIKTDERVILFSTFDGRSYGDSPKAIYEYMLNDPRFEDYKFVWAFRNPKQFTFILDNPDTYITTVNTRDYEKTCATAKYWIYNYRMSDHIYPKDDQVYIQLWHGTPLKRLGYDISVSDNAMNSKSEIREKYRVDAEKFKYILAPSHFAAEKFISAWNLKNVGREDTILELGYPRNDFLINYTQKDIDEIKKSLNLPDGKKYILYAPTWRDNQHKAGVGYVYKTEVDFDILREELGEEYIILFRAHYLVANSFDFERYSGFVYDVSRVNDINHLYVISDMLITDYSSVFFDYANLKRPEIFYMYDLEAYGSEIRGFYIELDELPGPIVKTVDELIGAIKNADNDKYNEKYEAFNKKFNYLDDGNAAKRVVEAIIEEL